MLQAQVLVLYTRDLSSLCSEAVTIGASGKCAKKTPFFSFSPLLVFVHIEADAALRSRLCRWRDGGGDGFFS